ncbi:MAG: VacJ family lipoprotein [Alcaligenaceae bacterium]|nr:VacJ family lipoprotein [Alcaligenaceae bacterium]
MTHNPDHLRPATARTPRLAKLAGILGAAALITGCATVQSPNPNDPWESYNRSMFAFNDAVDKALLKPIATGYDQLMPDPVQSCVHNIFNNLGDAWSAINSFFQGRGHDFANSLGRVLFNSTVGLGGCIDIASRHGSQRIPNDFGVTLGVWGVGSGPYFVLPFMGASSLRDSTAFVGTLAANISPLSPVLHMTDHPERNALLGLYIIDTRANLLDADRLVDDVALDRYSFIRDAYIQRRKALVEGRGNNYSMPDYANNETLPDYSDDEPADKPAASSGN